MQIIIKITDNSKAKVLLNFLKSLDFISILEKEEITYPTMTKEEILKRVAVTNKQIKNDETISHNDVERESENW